MNVVYGLRRDAFTKPGGDSGKVKRYQHALSQLGIESKIIVDPEDLSSLPTDNTVLHIFNTQVPFENIPYYKWAQAHNIPMVFSPIHHKVDHVRPYICNSLPLRMLGYSGTLWLKGLMKEVLIFRSARTISKFFNGQKSLNEKYLNNAIAVLPMSDLEMEHVKGDFEVAPSAKFVTIPNAISFKSELLEPVKTTPTIDVVVVGRIEPRKNSLKLARILGTTAYEVVFAGQKNLVHGNYCKNFEAEVSRHNNITWAGQLDEEALRSLYSSARVCLSHSHFEVVSQVDLEAASMGCSVVTSANSAIFDYFESPVLRTHPEMTGPEILEIIRQATSTEYTCAIAPEYQNSWDDVVNKLQLVYAACGLD